MNEKKKYADQDIYFVIGLVIMFLFVAVFVLYKLQILDVAAYMPPCLFHKLTGLSCPGCGCTRAVKALLNLRIVDSIRYNPMILLAVVWFIPYMISNVIARLLNLLEKQKGKKRTTRPDDRVVSASHNGIQITDKFIYTALTIWIAFWLIRLACEIWMAFRT